MLRQVAITALLALLVVDGVLSSTYEKKSDLSEFASAINGAGRLRYGKRSQPALFEPYRLMRPGGFEYEGDYAGQFEKRAPVNDFIANLNKAERLRFGRK